MEVQSFRAASLEHALQLVHQKLGPNAAVVQAREVFGGWWKALWGVPQFEILAAAPGTLDACREATLPIPRPTQLAFDASNSIAAEDIRGRLRSGLKQASFGVELSDTLPPNVPTPLLPPTNSFDLYAELLTAGFSDAAARDVANGVAKSWRPGIDPPLSLKFLREWLASGLKTQPGLSVVEGQNKRVAFVGPTGVGKTTTIAKLAAHFRLREGLRVGLITTDTFRIAAVDQLRSYADIMDLPLEVVTTPREMRLAIRRFEDLDFVCIDTAGRGPNDGTRLHELKNILGEAEPAETILVLSANSLPRVLTHIGQSFSILRPTAQVLTKIDETDGLAGIYPYLAASSLSVCYITTGQTVPNDIEPADPDRLCHLVLPST